MRVIHIAFLVVVGLHVEATAGPRSGGGSGDGDGGGRLASVSAGIAGATGKSTAGRGRGTTTGTRDWAVACPDDQYRRRVYDGVCVRRCPLGELYRANDGVCVRRAVALVLAPEATLEDGPQGTSSGPRRTARVAGYVGAQKVFESDGAFSLELAISDRWLRLGGALTRFYERQPSGDTLTLTMPSLALGVRIDDSSATRVYFEAGVVGAMTKHDPMMDSSITGMLGGVVAEHELSKQTTLIGAARLMGFQDDVRAASLRAGVRYRHVQASFSILDFNVGPALYGPEIGVGF
jgi:hypothetical protein